MSALAGPSGGPWRHVPFAEFLAPNVRPHTLGPAEDANLVGMRLYGLGPFHRELKAALRIAKKSHFVIRSGDVIYNKLFAWKGTFGIVPPELDGMFVSDKFPTYSLNRAMVDEGFLRWWFRHPALWEQARGMSTGSAALSKLTLNPPKFPLLTIPLPPPPEQRRIVAKLDHLFARIEAARGTRKHLSAERKALFGACLASLFGGLRPTGTLGEILTAKPRNGWSVRCDNDEMGVPVLSLSAVTGFLFDASAFKRTSAATSPEAHYWLSPGDLLITRSNTPDLVGHVAIYDGRPSPCIYPDLMMRISLEPSLADVRFTWLWLQTPLVRDFIRQQAKGTSPSMKKISQGTVTAIPFPAGVPLSTQRTLVARFERLNDRLRQVRKAASGSAAELDALMTAILDRAFRGEL